MNLQDIEDKWLNIAYSEKSLAIQNNGSYLAGNKGVGRFSCDRLGGQLDLVTRRKGMELLHLPISWANFEKEGDKDLTIQQIDLFVHDIQESQAAILTGKRNFPVHGTFLVVSHLRENWGREKLQTLKTSLEKFLNPNQLFLRNKFRISLSVPDLESEEKGKAYPDRISGDVENQIFDKLKFNTTYIETTISDKGKTVEVTLYHEGEKVFNLIERNDLYHFLDNAHAVIYFLNPYKKAYFTRQTGVRSVEFGSIFLFLNGFRVAPYGDRGDDWLGLDVRKAQGQQRYLGSREIIGRIEVTGSEKRFKPISSREGLKETPAFHQLKEVFFFDLLKKLEKFVVKGLEWDSIPDHLRSEVMKKEGLDWKNTQEQYSESSERKKQRIVLSLMTLIGSSPNRIKHFWFNPTWLEEVYENREEEVKTLIASIEGIDSSKVDPNLKKHLSKFKTLIVQKENEARIAEKAAADLRLTIVKKDKKIRNLKGKTETYKAQTLFLQQVTSFDVKQLMAYHHQINLDSKIVENFISKAIKDIRDLSGATSIIDKLQKASLGNKRIAAVAQFATKANFRSGTKKEITDIPSFFEQYLLNVATDFVAAGLNLTVTNLVDEVFEVKASRIELSILIDNIISNSGKALAKKVEVTISMISKNTIRITFVDNGAGLSDEITDIKSIFEMGITTRAGGSGLGLFHTKNIVKKISGLITATPLVNPKGMEIRIEVTR